MKKVKIGNKEYSKIIAGTNPFYGHSHFSIARDSEYKKRFSDDYIKNVLKLCITKGVNTIETSGNDRILSIINDIIRADKINLVGTTRIDETSPIKSHQAKLKYLIVNRADICIIHSQFVDRPGSSDEVKGLQSMVDEIHAAGLLAGISTHKNSTIEFCEKKYNIDVYLYPMNMLGFVHPLYDGNETVKDRIDLINNTNKQFIIMKTLAAGRIPPNEGLKFVLDNIKDNDLITLGLGSCEEVEESLDIVNLHLSDK